MSYLDAAMKRLEQMISDRLDAERPFRAVVASVDASGMVTITRLTATTAETQLRAVITTETLVEGDEVLCLPVSGEPVVIGKVHRGEEA